MAKSNNSFIKKQKADQRSKDRKEKMQKKAEKRGASKDGSLESMIMYVGADGLLTSEKPEELPNKD